MDLKAFVNYSKEAWERISLRGKEPKLPITSLVHLNRKMWGIPEAKLTVIGARTSNCKTAFAMQLMTDILNTGKSVLYLGFEMKQDELMERMFCAKYRIDNIELMTGYSGDYEKEWQEFTSYLNKLRFVAADQFGKTWEGLQEFVSSLETVPDVIVIDYIQAISQGSGDGKRFIDEYLLNFRNMCINTGFAGIVVSQLNRQSQDRTDKSPQLHDLKGSGYLEEIADLVLLLDWVGKAENSREFEINIAKNRRGLTGWVKCEYIGKHYLFQDMPPEVAGLQDDANQLHMDTNVS